MKGETTGPTDGRALKHDLLAPQRVLTAERGLRVKGYDTNDVGALRRVASDADVGARQDALIVLTHKCGREAIPALTQALDDPWSLVRCTAARLLGRLGDRSGLDRMRKDMVELAKPPQEGEPSKNKPAAKPLKGSVLRWKEGQLQDALAAAAVLAEFGDSSGYELAARAVFQSEHAAVRTIAIIVLADLCMIDKPTLQAKGYDPEAVLLRVAESETRASVLTTLVASAAGRMSAESQIRIYEAIERSPHSSGLSDLQRLAIRNGLAQARKQLAQEKETGRKTGDH